MNQGRAISEASQEVLSARADMMIVDLLARTGGLQQPPNERPEQRLSGAA